MDNHSLGNEGELNSELEVGTGSTHFKPAGTQSWTETIKKNLFKDGKNTLLTILTILLVSFLLFHIFQFIFTNSWDVVHDNLRDLMIGRYPIEEVWRIWTGLAYLTFALGLSWGVWKGVLKQVTLTLGGVYVAFSILGLFGLLTTRTLFILLFLLFLIGIGFAIGHFGSAKFTFFPILLFVLWALYIPLSFGLLQGFWGLFPAVRSNRWEGFFLTVMLSKIAIIGCFPLGILLALGRRSKMPAIKWFCILYIELIRGMPLIMVLFLGRVFIPLFLGGVNIELVIRAMWAYTFFAAAYLAENIRGGLQSIPTGQYEAAHALGMSSVKMTLFIILPQAIKAVIPALVGQFITIFKDTSLVAIIGMADFLGTAQRINANPQYLGRYMELYVFIAAFYFVFCYLMAYVSRHMEHSLSNRN